MTIKRIVYTGRERIKHEDIHIQLKTDNDGKNGFTIRLSLDSYGFPVGASVCVEAYLQTFWERFELGNAGAHIIGSPRFFPFERFSIPDGVMFRVKVTDTGTRAGILLAEAHSIRPKSPEEDSDGRISILSTRPEPLENELYRLDLTNWPTLCINDKLVNWKETAQNPWFRSLVHPAVIRQIATHLFINGSFNTETDQESWEGMWLKYLCDLVPFDIKKISEQPSEDWERVSEWIDVVIAEFANRHNLKDVYPDSQGDEK